MKNCQSKVDSSKANPFQNNSKEKSKLAKAKYSVHKCYLLSDKFDVKKLNV